IEPTSNATYIAIGVESPVGGLSTASPVPPSVADSDSVDDSSVESPPPADAAGTLLTSKTACVLWLLSYSIPATSSGTTMCIFKLIGADMSPTCSFNVFVSPLSLTTCAFPLGPLTDLT